MSLAWTWIVRQIILLWCWFLRISTCSCPDPGPGRPWCSYTTASWAMLKLLYSWCHKWRLDDNIRFFQVIYINAFSYVSTVLGVYKVYTIKTVLAKGKSGMRNGTWNGIWNGLSLPQNVIIIRPHPLITHHNWVVKCISTYWYAMYMYPVATMYNVPFRIKSTLSYWQPL